MKKKKTITLNCPRVIYEKMHAALRKLDIYPTPAPNIFAAGVAEEEEDVSTVVYITKGKVVELLQEEVEELASYSSSQISKILVGMCQGIIAHTKSLGTLKNCEIKVKEANKTLTEYFE